MLNAKIKISQVNNLTDARYFSAWGVDYLGFDINPDSSSFVAPPLLKEIADWVEGPAIVLEASDIQGSIWIKNYLEILGNVLLEKRINDKKDLMILEGGPLSDKKVVTYISNLTWSSISQSLMSSLVRDYDEVYVDIPFGITELDMILDAGVAGFVMRGGQEEKIGFKSYNDLDEIFDHLSV